MKELYEKYESCVVQIIVKNHVGDTAIGTGFHIGDGYIVTARHIVEDHIIESVAGTYSSRNVTIKNIFYPSSSKIDLAVLETDFSLDSYMEKTTIIEDGKPKEKVDRIPLGEHLDDWIGDELVLSKVVAFGYPKIPLSKEYVLVAVQGEINAVIDKYLGPHPHFIISSTARKGFIGGPVISEYDFLLVGHLSRPLPLLSTSALTAKWSATVSATAAQSMSSISCSVAPPFAFASPHEGRGISVPALGRLLQPVDNLLWRGGMFSI